jgi:hypothetical protein
VLHGPVGRSSRMRQVHHDHEAHTGCPEIRPEGPGVHGQVSGPHRVADRLGRDSAITIESDGAQMIPRAEGGIDPLVAEHGHPGSRGLTVEHGERRAEQWLAIEGRRRGRRLAPMRPGEDSQDEDRGRRHRQRLDTTRAPAVVDIASNTLERRQPGACPPPETGQDRRHQQRDDPDDGSGQARRFRSPHGTRDDAQGGQRSPAIASGASVDHESQRGPAKEGQERDVPQAVPVNDAGPERHRVARGVRHHRQQEQHDRRDGQRSTPEVRLRSRHASAPHEQPDRQTKQPGDGERGVEARPAQVHGKRVGDRATDAVHAAVLAQRRLRKRRARPEEECGRIQRVPGVDGAPCIPVAARYRPRRREDGENSAHRT